MRGSAVLPVCSFLLALIHITQADLGGGLMKGAKDTFKKLGDGVKKETDSFNAKLTQAAHKIAIKLDKAIEKKNLFVQDKTEKKNALANGVA